MLMIGVSLSTISCNIAGSHLTKFWNPAGSSTSSSTIKYLNLPNAGLLNSHGLHRHLLCLLCLMTCWCWCWTISFCWSSNCNNCWASCSLRTGSMMTRLRMMKYEWKHDHSISFLFPSKNLEFLLKCYVLMSSLFVVPLSLTLAISLLQY